MSPDSSEHEQHLRAGIQLFDRLIGPPTEGQKPSVLTTLQHTYDALDTGPLDDEPIMPLDSEGLEETAQ